MIVNEISLKKFLTYTSSVYEIENKFNSLERRNLKISGKGVNTKTKASTAAKMMFMNCFCFNKSINELVLTTHNENTSLYNFFDKKEYIPKTHALRDCIIDTDYHQLEEINDYVINRAKENKFFNKNKIDGLCVLAWDGVETTETSKNIINLPEREHSNGTINKYIKYICAMNVGERGNIFITQKQMSETEKVLSKSGAKKAKTFGETTAFVDMLPVVEKKIGRIVDVHVFDALYLTSNVMNCISTNNQYFIIRMEDKTKNIYKDAEGVFKRSKLVKEYEIVEAIENIKVKYTKEAKHKDYEKTKVKKEYRKITDRKLNEKSHVETKVQNKKNSTKEIKIYEKVIKRIQVWSDEFNYANYNGKVRAIKSVEKTWKEGKEQEQEIYIATNMMKHSIETIVKIMHYRWNIENNGFRNLKQNYKLEHIFIGENNSINYILQMIILVNNLLELYLKVRLKEKLDIPFYILKKTFEREINKTKNINVYFKCIT